LSSFPLLVSNHLSQFLTLQAQRSLGRLCDDARLPAVQPSARSRCPLTGATRLQLSPFPSRQVRRIL
jgi:hypothetical protein